ncbi:Serine/threonine-protein kinase [Podospora aff. communis PSN243]|uniref:Serine/threonine-protein kinase n=1 Tax=Podospora aff. communis PSN243 TaxID=3040156 RepID=A0AAV9GTV9_9PEZI|nr:Serine/threonine-protein kinase [Podospora aff. communis PSN243]
MEAAYPNGGELTLALRGRPRDSGVAAGGGLGQQLTVHIIEPISPPTMSIVLKVRFHDTTKGCERIAVLKLFDRRFSPEVRRRRNPLYDEDAQAAWCEYVQAGKAEALFADTDPSSEEDPETGAKTKRVRTPAELRMKKGKREGIIQWDCRDVLISETRAYSKLSHLQGRYIPRLLAEVHPTIPTPPELPKSASYRHDYFDIGGVLLEYIDGFNLSELGVTETSIPKEKWHPIIQQAVDAARYINDAGVVKMDCQPRNVVVERETLRPFHIDFGLCVFAEDMGWEKFGERRLLKDNPRAIGIIMQNRMRSAGTVLADFRYVRRDWGRFGSMLTRLSLEMTSWSAQSIGVVVAVGVFAVEVIQRGLYVIRGRR